MPKGVGEIIAGVILGILSLFGWPGYQLWKAISDHQSAEIFMVPTSRDLGELEPGRYYLWDHQNELFEGKVYQSPSELPAGMEIEVRDEKGNEIPIKGDRSITSSENGREGKTVASFLLAEQTSCELRVSGEFEPRLFSVSRSPFEGFGDRILSFLAVLLVGGIGSVGLIVWGGVQLTRKSRGPTPPPMPQ